ncbi:hypothetical protein AQJ66_10440 [Streptomyces bungoensis]|uniref:RlpA-like protein double-psi beta-barrel domain-containing protein n=1 Tax=Streptomyces bungoensis TaxID=285568 RepID=A0A117RF43_9ACTN|nr:expansin EXLX1 family cellulose-binding protein [Streptomyces bungoensis]KUN87358.1 hypothetical protein AQJ66_10440 [Streptomyces bungoensis]
MVPSSHRRPARGRRTVLVSAVAAAAVGLLAALVVAFVPDGGSHAAGAAATPSVSARPSVPPTAPARRQATASAAPAPVPKRTAAPSASARPSSPRASAAGAPRAASGAAPLAGRIAPGVTHSSVATHYDAGDGDGACLYGPSPDLMIAAMNHTDYEASKACGAYLSVRAAGGASVTVRVTNECPECAPGQLDLSEQAFAKLAALSAGRIPVSWSLLSPGTSGTVSIRYKTGSSRNWCGIQAIGHRNPLARLEVGTGTGWRPLTRTDYDYFLSEDGTGCGGPLRLTDIYGERLTVDGIAIRPDTVQPTRVQFARH